MIKIFRVLALAASLAALPLAARADIFMLVPGVQGDATAKGHEKWIRVSSLDWEVQADTSWVRGSGATVGKPNPGPIDLVLATGTWSRHFVRAIVAGSAFPNVVIDATASDGRPLYRITAEGLFLTDYRLDTLPAAPLPQDHVSGVFKKVKIDYYSVGADGRVTTTTVEWDVVLGTSAVSP
jgi:type VI protein secretion system component Hcp